MNNNLQVQQQQQQPHQQQQKLSPSDIQRMRACYYKRGPNTPKQGYNCNVVASQGQRRSSKKARRQRIEGPNTNDVVCVCYSVPISAGIPQGRVITIQPNSTHHGNQQFGHLVERRAQSYQTTGDSDEREQQRQAQSIVNDVEQMGGRFLVFIKEQQHQKQQQQQHANNGSWCVVENDDVQKISRYALLKQAEATQRLLQQQQLEKVEQQIIESSNSNIVNIIHGINIHDEDGDDDDLWSIGDGDGMDSLSGYSDSYNDSDSDMNEYHQNPSCWEYKILLP